MKKKFTQFRVLKGLLVLLTFLIIQSVSAQAPHKMSYQAVIRNANNELVRSSIIRTKISLLLGSPTGNTVYSEWQTQRTDYNGLLSLKIGEGNILLGEIEKINWGDGSYYIKTETDPTGGTDFSLVSSVELMSVPYALYSYSGGGGTQGLKGDTGLTGAKGDKGEAGTNGTDGVNGTQGLKGDTGLTGAKGDKGEAGTNGTSGTYTPTFTAVSNISSYSLNWAAYTRIGNMVHVSICVNLKPTATSSNSQFNFTLPFSTISAVGSGLFIGQPHSGLVLKISISEGYIYFTSVNTLNQTINIQYDYEVL